MTDYEAQTMTLAEARIKLGEPERDARLAGFLEAASFEPERDARLAGFLEAASFELLGEIWKLARPDDPCPENVAIRGYGLYEYFCGC